MLTKSPDKESALIAVDSFLQDFKDRVWDWYQVGGRWTNALAPVNKLKEFEEYTESLFEKNEHGFLLQSEVDNKQPELQSKWEELGLLGKNTMCNHYHLPETGNTYDVIPLNDCIEKVKEWVKDLDAAARKAWDRMIEGGFDDYSSAYRAEDFYNAKKGKFCFDTNVYDISEYEAEKVPDTIDGYFAVMIDIHN